MLLITLIISFALLFPGPGATPSRKPHRHSKLADVREELASEVKIVGILFEIAPKKAQVARSPNKKFEAFTVEAEGDAGDRIFFVERSSGIIYEITGIPLPHRPFSDLVWIDNHTLVFDRWSQPHYGIHYAVNVVDKKLVTASAFPD